MPRPHLTGETPRRANTVTAPVAADTSDAALAHLPPIYNYDGVIYFLGMIICLILVFLILYPLKYEYHEFIHDEWREGFNSELEECNRKIDELKKRTTDVTQKTTNK